MPKKFQKSIAALFIVSTLGACAELPMIGAQDSPEPTKAVASDSPFVDYWQTRDPSDYRRASLSSGTGAQKPVIPSQDVTFSGQDKTPVKIGKKAEPRISLILPVQSGRVAEAVERREVQGQGSAGTVVANTSPAIASKVGRNSVVSNQKGKRKPTATASQDLWSRVRGRLVLTDVEHARIDEQIEYLKRNPGYVNLFSQRAKPFLHYLVEQIDRRGLPMDLVLVPMVESAFEPTAVSPKEAAGLWQIIPTTGQERGLLLAEGYDGRFDIHTSTEAALDYLSYLNKLFKGDWLLTLAAYNAGPRAVQEAIESSKKPATPVAASTKNPPSPRSTSQTSPVAARPSTTLPVASPSPPVAGTVALESPATTLEEAEPQSPYWLLKLPKETLAYVPRILALSRVVANPDGYGLRLPPIGNQPYLFRVDVTPDIKIPEALAVTSIPIDEFFRFNPGFKPGVEPPPHAYKLLLPLDRAQDLVAKVPGARLVAANKYTVRKGETLAIIAKKHGIPSQTLAQWNSLSVDSVLKAGQKLVVYPAS
jgi:LysM repeat protein